MPCSRRPACAIELLLVNGGHGLDFPTHYSNLVPDVLEFLDATWKD